MPLLSSSKSYGVDSVNQVLGPQRFWWSRHFRDPAAYGLDPRREHQVRSDR